MSKTTTAPVVRTVTNVDRIFNEIYNNAKNAYTASYLASVLELAPSYVQNVLVKLQREGSLVYLGHGHEPYTHCYTLSALGAQQMVTRASLV